MVLFAQPLRSRRIVFHLLRVRIAIHLDHQFGFRAEEIDDVGIDGVLLTRPGGPPALHAGHTALRPRSGCKCGQMRTVELTVAQTLP